MKTPALAILFATCVAAQTLTEPPPLIQLVRKPGWDATGAQMYRSAHAGVNVIGLASVTGFAETWMLELHDSFSSIEGLDQAAKEYRTGSMNDRNSVSQDEMLGGSRTMIAVSRPGWSYRPSDAIQLFGKARYFSVSIYRARPGSEEHLADLVNMRRVSFDSMNLDRPDIAYHIISGAASGTYIFLAPLTSLKTLDNGAAKTPVYAEGAADPATVAKLASVADVVREHLLFRVEPKLSHVSNEFVSADPDFWSGRR